MRIVRPLSHRDRTPEPRSSYRGGTVARTGWPLGKQGTAFVVILLAAYAYGRWGKPDRPPKIVREIVTRQVVPEAFQRAVGELVLDNRGLRARLEGVERRPPRVVLQTDTVLRVDTVLHVLRNSGGLVNSVSVIGDSVTVMERGIDLRDCDDGWGYSGGVWSCDPARFGHLALFGGIQGTLDGLGPDAKIGAEPLIGLRWRPSYRSEWDVRLSRTWDAWQAQITRGLRIW